MTDGGFWSARTRPWKDKKLIFRGQMRDEEGQSGRTFPPQRPRNSTWTRAGGRLQGVNLDFQRRTCCARVTAGLAKEAAEGKL